MFENILQQIARGLDSRGIPYMIIGGQAVLAYGEPRLTRDVDVTLGIGPERVQDILSLAQASSWDVLPEKPAEFAKERFVLPCLESSTGIRIDLIFSTSAYERQAIARGRMLDVNGTPVRYASVEDLVVHKIIAGRPRDIEDARNVALKNSSIDREFVKQTLTEIDPDMTPEYLDRLRDVFSA